MRLRPAVRRAVARAAAEIHPKFRGGGCGGLAQTAGTGTSSFGALDTNTLAGIDLNGTAFTLNGAVTTTAGGPVTITNSGALTIAAAADMTLDGAFLQDGAGAVGQSGRDRPSGVLEFRASDTQRPLPGHSTCAES